ncbi:MAG: serine/threonine-protein kinase [Gemmatimonadota bacterium]
MTAAASPEFLALQAAVAGRYSLVRELGRGGMGVVFLAREVALDRLVAIKLLPPGLASQPVLRERFLREARTAAGLSHPHIVAIHAVDSAGALVFFVMEYVAGETLGERLRRRGALSTADALRVTQEVAWALAHAHARGVIHRDVKPDNILLEEGTDRAIVTDFGIAQAGISGDTPVGVGLGTFHYMSPEQAAGEPVDARTDVYALGVTAFHAVTGHRPFEGYDGAALLAQQAHTDPPTVGDFPGGLPQRFTAAIDRAIRRDPAARWDHVEAMAQELSAARALVPALPAPVRVFARRLADIGGRLSILVSVGAMSWLLMVLFFGNSLNAIPFYVAYALSVGAFVLSLGELLVGVRRFLAAGYSRATALRALRGLDADDHESDASRHDEVTWTDRPALLVVAGVAGAALGMWMLRYTDGAVGGIGGLMLAVGSPLTALRNLWRLRRRRASLWTRLLDGRLGRWMFSVAAMGLGAVRSSPTSGEPTALALGGAIGELFERLSEPQQRALAAVPDLIERLETMAMDRGHGVEAVMALETLRLDLLRLHAGEIAAESLTQGLEELQQVGRQVDAVLELRADP